MRVAEPGQAEGTQQALGPSGVSQCDEPKTIPVHNYATCVVACGHPRAFVIQIFSRRTPVVHERVQPPAETASRPSTPRNFRPAPPVGTRTNPISEKELPRAPNPDRDRFVARASRARRRADRSERRPRPADRRLDLDLPAHDAAGLRLPQGHPPTHSESRAGHLGRRHQRRQRRPRGHRRRLARPRFSGSTRTGWSSRRSRATASA